MILYLKTMIQSLFLVLKRIILRVLRIYKRFKRFLLKFFNKCVTTVIYLLTGFEELEQIFIKDVFFFSLKIFVELIKLFDKHIDSEIERSSAAALKLYLLAYKEFDSFLKKKADEDWFLVPLYNFFKIREYPQLVYPLQFYKDMNKEEKIEFIIYMVFYLVMLLTYNCMTGIQLYYAETFYQYDSLDLHNDRFLRAFCFTCPFLFFDVCTVYAIYLYWYTRTRNIPVDDQSPYTIYLRQIKGDWVRSLVISACFMLAQLVKVSTSFWLEFSWGIQEFPFNFHTHVPLFNLFGLAFIIMPIVGIAALFSLLIPAFKVFLTRIYLTDDLNPNIDDYLLMLHAQFISGIILIWAVVCFFVEFISTFKVRQMHFDVFWDVVWKYDIQGEPSVPPSKIIHGNLYVVPELEDLSNSNVPDPLLHERVLIKFASEAVRIGKFERQEKLLPNKYLNEIYEGVPFFADRFHRLPLTELEKKWQKENPKSFEFYKQAEELYDSIKKAKDLRENYEELDFATINEFIPAALKLKRILRELAPFDEEMARMIKKLLDEIAFEKEYADTIISSCEQCFNLFY